jgi:hypothetical protein
MHAVSLFEYCTACHILDPRFDSDMLEQRDRENTGRT